MLADRQDFGEDNNSRPDMPLIFLATAKDVYLS
jgi:hypothetical protein